MTDKEIRDALLDAINECKPLFAELEAFPEKVEKTVEAFTPVSTGESKRAISLKHRHTALKRLSTRRVKLGEVYSDDDPAKVNSLEFGRGEDAEHGGTPEFAMLRRAAAYWADIDIEKT